MPKRKSKSNKYHPKSQWSKRQKTINSAREGYSGFLFTCDTHRRREAKRDAFNMLHSAAEHLDELKNFTFVAELEDNPDTTDDKNDDNTKTSSDATTTNDANDDDANDGLDLAAEIAAMKATTSSSSSTSKISPYSGKHTTATRYTVCETGNIKGLFVLTLQPNEPHNPIEYVSQFCATARESGFLNSRYITRTYPLETICRGREKDFAPTLLPLLDAYLEKCTTTGTKTLPWTFAIDYKGRHMGKGFREKAISTLADAVAAQHKIWSMKMKDGKETEVLKVDLTNPAFVVVCQAFSPLCGISVVDGEEHRRCGKYNLTKMEGVELPEEKEVVKIVEEDKVVVANVEE